MSSERGFVPFAVVGIVALTLLIALGAAYPYFQKKGSEQTPAPIASEEKRPAVLPADSPALPEKTVPAARAIPRENQPAPSSPPSSTASEAAKLQAEIQMSLKTGGISPTRYGDIVRELNELAARGLDTRTYATLSSMLKELTVGGSEPIVTSATQGPPPSQQPMVTERGETKPFWEYNPSRTSNWHYWARAGTPPACPQPLVLPAPVDLTLVTAILYPGQVRGDGPKDFKPHGGFTLKAGTKSVELRAPMDGYLTSVAKFTDEFGLHYGLTFQNPCGIQFGGGHFGALPADIQAVVDKVPLKGYGESRTEPILPPYFVKKGQVIVTGLQEKANPERPGFDWGVADLRQTNAASKDPRFQSLYGYAPWNTYYGVCWLDLLPPEQESIVRSFPGGDYKEGKHSEYCSSQ